jgi:peroxiredoxin
MKLSLAISLIVATATLYGQEFKVGSNVNDFQVQDLDGKAISFSALRGPVTVVTFIATQCPVSNAYNQRMIAVYQDYTPKKVKFIFVNANRSESASEVRDHARRAGFPFPVYKDANNVLANRFGAEVTPESYVIDDSGVIRYHGSIDDSQNEARIRTHGLRLALEALLAGKPVPMAETKAFGCTIKRVRKSS